MGAELCFPTLPPNRDFTPLRTPLKQGDKSQALEGGEKRVLEAKPLWAGGWEVRHPKTGRGGEKKLGEEVNKQSRSTQA
jgi:hypothetical protein